jgi:hypothetical protein
MLEVGLYFSAIDAANAFPIREGRIGKFCRFFGLQLMLARVSNHLRGAADFKGFENVPIGALLIPYVSPDLSACVIEVENPFQFTPAAERFSPLTLRQMFADMVAGQAEVAYSRVLHTLRDTKVMQLK